MARGDVVEQGAILEVVEQNDAPSQIPRAEESGVKPQGQSAGDAADLAPSMPPGSEPAPGLELGQYCLLHELGRGAFGRVFKAQHKVMDRMVALKVISPELVADKLVYSLFRREVLMATQLCHPNIVMAYDANNAAGMMYLVMEYVDGLTLEAQVVKEGPLPFDVAREMLRQAGLALQYAFEKGMVHRDIKPANLLIPHSAGLNGVGSNPTATRAARPATAPLMIKIADFGLARLHNMAYSNTVLSKCEKGFMGTPEFVSPEQARNPRAADIRSDLYSLGCTFYFALTGRRPFKGDTPVETVMKHLEERPEPLESLRRDIPPDLAVIVHRLMDKDPRDRFQTPADLVAALDQLDDATTVPEPDAKPAGPTPTFLASTTPHRNEPASLAPWLPEPPRHDTREGPGTATPAEASPPAEAAAPGWPANAPLAEIPGGQKTLSSESLGPPDLCEDGVRETWREWTAVVEAVAGGTDPRRFHEPAYRELHGRLLRAFRSRAGTAAPERQELYRRLESLVEPWMTPYALELADRATLLSLLQHCRRLELGLFVPKRSWTIGLWVVVLGALFTAVGIGTYLGRAPDAASAARSLVAPAWQAVKTHPVLWTALGLTSVGALAFFMLARAGRGRS